jgi:hypothetical protein
MMTHLTAIVFLCQKHHPEMAGLLAEIFCENITNKIHRSIEVLWLVVYSYYKSN